ncbi:unnamed protein product [Symbiodinium natans]|uniref:Uncharacterized protein n=1 Tax=Symbiodinium natans TaxID=878477 RepID=A0A812IG25_9DINO|nr:unnamed protein product [Symbiodinium natans]
MGGDSDRPSFLAWEWSARQCKEAKESSPLARTLLKFFRGCSASLMSASWKESVICYFAQDMQKLLVVRLQQRGEILELPLQSLSWIFPYSFFKIGASSDVLYLRFEIEERAELALVLGYISAHAASFVQNPSQVVLALEFLNVHFEEALEELGSTRRCAEVVLEVSEVFQDSRFAGLTGAAFEVQSFASRIRPRFPWLGKALEALESLGCSNLLAGHLSRKVAECAKAEVAASAAPAARWRVSPEARGLFDSLASSKESSDVLFAVSRQDLRHWLSNAGTGSDEVDGFILAQKIAQLSSAGSLADRRKAAMTSEMSLEADVMKELNFEKVGNGSYLIEVKMDCSFHQFQRDPKSMKLHADEIITCFLGDKKKAKFLGVARGSACFVWVVCKIEAIVLAIVALGGVGCEGLRRPWQLLFGAFRPGFRAQAPIPAHRGDSFQLSSPCSCIRGLIRSKMPNSDIQVGGSLRAHLRPAVMSHQVGQLHVRAPAQQTDSIDAVIQQLQPPDRDPRQSYVSFVERTAEERHSDLREKLQRKCEEEKRNNPVEADVITCRCCAVGMVYEGRAIRQAMCEQGSMSAELWTAHSLGGGYAECVEYRAGTLEDVGERVFNITHETDPAIIESAHEDLRRLESHFQKIRSMPADQARLLRSWINQCKPAMARLSSR